MEGRTEKGDEGRKEERREEEEEEREEIMGTKEMYKSEWRKISMLEFGRKSRDGGRGMFSVLQFCLVFLYPRYVYFQL